MKKRLTRKAILILLAIALAVGLGAMLIPAASSRAALREQLELGERYITELDYEAAILAFSKALEIDPKNVDAYLGLAEAYIALGDRDSAIAQLRAGFALTSDPRLADRLAELGVDVTALAALSGEINADKELIVGEEVEPTLRRLIEKYEGALYVKDFLGVTEMSFTNVNDITFLENFPWLTSLSISGDELPSLKPLEAMTALSRLSVNYEKIGDASSLNKLKNLTSLSIYQAPLTDFSFLSVCENLTELVLHNIGLTDLSVLLQLPSPEKLLTLNVASNKISDFSVLKSFPSLTTLNVIGNSYQSMSALTIIQTMRSLRDFSAIMQQNSDWDVLIPLAGQLTRLSLNMDSITDISAVSKFTALTGLSLNLFGPDYLDYTPIGKLTGLTSLALCYSNISDLTPLAALVNLESLDLSNLGVSYDNGPVEGNGKITDISLLAGLTKLTRLNLQYNNISDISPLSGMTALKSLDLHGNNISDLTPLSEMKSFDYVNLKDNPVTDWSPVSHIRSVLGRPSKNS